MDASFQFNPSKCYWFASKVQYLGFEISRDGITMQLDAVPKTQRDVRHFVSQVNFYRDLYPCPAEILTP